MIDESLLSIHPAIHPLFIGELDLASMKWKKEEEEEGEIWREGKVWVGLDEEASGLQLLWC